MNRHRRQRGFLLIAAIVLVVVAAVLATTMAFISVTSGGTASDSLQSGQAIFVAESGVEFEARSMAQNVDWYRSTTDPLGLATQNFGQGSFTVQTNLPATLLRARANAGDTTITAYTTNRFPNFSAVPSPPTTCNPCYLQLDDDINTGAEYVRYTGIAGNTFTGLLRPTTIGGHTGTVSARDRSTTVYPVTTLSVALPASCAAPANVQIVAHSKFLDVGTLDIEGEEIGYKNSSSAGGVMTLTGITRCLDDVTGPPGNTPAPHAVLAPVTPVLIGDFSKDYEAQVVSTGTVGSVKRTMNRVLTR
jgi:type II secretory pathway pseudopilin PulG